ncbi:MAG TPA: fasciclin domain-containing protein, partial [Polyangiaceae bacterium]|nr:fasciclin domain-containing protein [Polyangiaceae bacterium]
DALKDVLLYHVVSGAIGSGDLEAGSVPTLLSGKSLTVNLSAGVAINDAKVTSANIIAKNGVIHVVDTVLVPK